MESGGAEGQVGVGRERSRFLPRLGTRGGRHTWDWPPPLCPGVLGPPGKCWAGPAVGLSVQAEFRVLHAADLRTGLSFPRQKREGELRVRKTPDALLAAPLNSQSSKEEETSGQGSVKKDANRDMQVGQRGGPLPPAG